MAKRANLAQGMLFGDSPAARLHDVVGPAQPDPSVARLAAALASRTRGLLHLGTSSWSFPGWQQLVWDRPVTKDNLARFGLAAYAAHPLFRTVGLDRTFYAPMPEHELADLADMTPPDFRFLVKAHQVCTRPATDEHGRTFGATGGMDKPNPEFLAPSYAIARVVGPSVLGLAGRCGPIVFQFPPMDLSPRGQVAGVLGLSAKGGLTGAGVVSHLLDRLERFLAALPVGPQGPRSITPLYAVEVRNRELLTPRYIEILRSRGIVTALAGHPSQPPLADQHTILQPAAGSALVIRWLLHPSEKYESAKSRYEPFDNLVDPDPPARSAVTTLCIEALAKGLPTYVVANNKAEGSAPRSIEKLARQIAAVLDVPADQL